MASTYTTTLALQLMATGENAGTWGSITNTNLTVVQQAIVGYQAVSIAGGAQTTALVVTQNALSNAKNAVLKFTGTITGNQIVTVPNGITKTWIVSNGTTGAFTVTFKYASTGTGITWSTTDKAIKILYADGTDIRTVDLSTLSGTVGAAQITTSTITTTQLAAGAVLGNNIATSTITATKLAANSVVANNIVTSTITQSKLAANSVGANQLINTAVTAGSYTAASITVDADGRITAASSGSAGAGMGIPILATYGPSSGTLTASPTANRLAVYAWSGGGGGGGGRGQNYGNLGGSGGAGVYGFYNVPISQPFSKAYAAGAPGSPGMSTGMGGAPGGSGGATSITNVFTMNGGNAGAGAPSGMTGGSGSAGSASPAVTYAFPLRGFLISAPTASDFGVGGYSNADSGGQAGGAGGTGALVVFENSGT